MFRAAALALCAAMAWAAPAYAADVTTLRCLEDGLDATARKLLLDDLKINLDNSGKTQSYRPETTAAIQAAARACQTRYAWSDAATKASILYTLPKIGWPLADKLARAKNLNPDALVRRFRALTPAERRDALKPEVLDKLARGALAGAEIKEENSALGGALFGLLALQEKAQADFKDS